MSTCRRGHPRTPETTYVFPNGKRQCRICIRAAKAAFRKRERMKEHGAWTRIALSEEFK